MSTRRTLDSVGSHTHRVNAHTHQVSAHTHRVNAHTHTVKDHTHALEFGIYEGQRATKATIKVDGNEVPATSGYDNIDIVAYLSKDNAGKIRRGTWHTVEILPDTMSRIVGQRLCADLLQFARRRRLLIKEAE